MVGCYGSVLLYISAGVVLLLSVVVYAYYKNAFQYWKKKGIPYLEPKFFFGNFKEGFFGTKMITEIVVEWYKTMKAQGHKHMGVYTFTNPIYMPIDPEYIKNMLAIDFQHFHDRGFYHNEEHDPLSSHLFSLTGLKWKHLRAKLTPTFTSGKLKKMFQTLVDCSYELTSCLNDHVVKDEPVDIRKVLAQYTTNVIGSCAFGIECNCFKDPNTDFIRLGRRLFEQSFIDRMKGFLAFQYPSVAKFFNLRLTNKEVDVFFRGLVKETIEYREKNNVIRHDFLDLLIQLKNKGSVDDDETAKESENKPEVGTTLTMNEIAAQVFLFFVAGFDTSSTAMTFALYELARNQPYQNKLREEIVRVLKRYDGKVTYDALKEMQYMNQILDESMRVYPPIGFLQRECTKDYKIPNTNIILEKGITVLIPTQALQTDPEYYPNPEKFDPDRFSEENKASRGSDFTYLPFGEGPRQCIGKRFGIMQVKIGLCQLLLNYKFTVNPKTKEPLEMDPKIFIPTPKSGIWLSVEKVTN